MSDGKALPETLIYLFPKGARGDTSEFKDETNATVAYCPFCGARLARGESQAQRLHHTEEARRILREMLDGDKGMRELIPEEVAWLKVDHEANP